MTDNRTNEPTEAQVEAACKAHEFTNAFGPERETRMRAALKAAGVVPDAATKDLEDQLANAKAGWDSALRIVNSGNEIIKQVGAERDAALADKTYWHEVATKAKDQRDSALARIAEAAKLHRKYTYYDLEDSCLDTTDEHREEHHHESEEIGEFYCDQMPTGDVCCETCRDVNGDRMDWPCPTAVSLGMNEGENE